MSAPAMARACKGSACMRLEYTERQNKFREEIRGWLATHVPKQPLTSFDTEAGFSAHRACEAKLFEGRWSAVTWPHQYRGRACRLTDWLLFEEGHWRANATPRGHHNDHSLLAPPLRD